MKIIKIVFLLGVLFSLPVFLNAENKVSYEDITAEAINISPEKYKLKPLCLTTKFRPPEKLAWYFSRTNIASDKFFQIPVNGLREIKIIARKQEFEDDFKKIKPDSHVKLSGRIKHLARVNAVQRDQIYYFELEKIEDLTDSGK
jgi:hypothetical protein